MYRCDEGQNRRAVLAPKITAIGADQRLRLGQECTYLASNSYTQKNTRLVPVVFWSKEQVAHVHIVRSSGEVLNDRCGYQAEARLLVIRVQKRRQVIVKLSTIKNEWRSRKS